MTNKDRVRELRNYNQALLDYMADWFEKEGYGSKEGTATYLKLEAKKRYKPSDAKRTLTDNPTNTQKLYFSDVAGVFSAASNAMKKCAEHWEPGQLKIPTNGRFTWVCQEYVIPGTIVNDPTRVGAISIVWTMSDGNQYGLTFPIEELL